MSAEVVLEGVRLSMAVRCARAAVYQGLDIPGREHTVEEERRFRRGHALADVAKTQIAEDLDRQGRTCETEVEVPWGDGWTGHADLRVDGDGLVEITTTSGCDLAEHKAFQVACYALELGASSAAVLVIDPTTGEERYYPINIEAFRNRWDALKQQILDGVRDGVAPDRVCRHPFDGPAMFCPFGGPDGYCFQGWQPTTVHPQAPAAFQALADLHDRVATAPPAEAEELKQLREDVRAEVLAYVETDGSEHVAGDVLVKVTEVRDRDTFSLAQMRAAGFELPAELAAFVSTGGGHLRWTVRRIGPRDNQ